MLFFSNASAVVCSFEVLEVEHPGAEGTAVLDDPALTAVVGLADGVGLGVEDVPVGKYGAAASVDLAAGVVLAAGVGLAAGVSLATGVGLAAGLPPAV